MDSGSGGSVGAGGGGGGDMDRGWVGGHPDGGAWVKRGTAGVDAGAVNVEEEKSGKTEEVE